MLKNVLITGAAGFLGSHLCDRFIKEGFNVISDELSKLDQIFVDTKFEFGYVTVSYTHLTLPTILLV